MGSQRRHKGRRTGLIGTVDGEAASHCAVVVDGDRRNCGRLWPRGSMGTTECGETQLGWWCCEVRGTYTPGTEYNGQCGLVLSVSGLAAEILQRSEADGRLDRPPSCALHAEIQLEISELDIRARPSRRRHLDRGNAEEVLEAFGATSPDDPVALVQLQTGSVPTTGSSAD